MPMSTTEELGYFYDAIHGSVSVVDLPNNFVPALKSALLSKSLDRLKRVSQLGHTSVSFFSATHTRFSHAIGTMLVMNKLLKHLQQHSGLSTAIFTEAKEQYSTTVAQFNSDVDMVHCHMLLAALYQDVGELPFQKVTSSYFTPAQNEVRTLATKFPSARPRAWKAKTVFTMLSVIHDFTDAAIRNGFEKFNLDFLMYLITGDGAPPGRKNIPALRGLLDDVIDADRLDYIYRDASATIGSLSRPGDVIESVIRYEPGRVDVNDPRRVPDFVSSGRVVVNDPRPVTDFLSTRMRLLTFVYSSPDVRFRQVLLKTVLDGYWDQSAAKKSFADAKLQPELSHDAFMKLDDSSLVTSIKELDSNVLEGFRQQARTLLLHDTFDYECRVLKRKSPGSCSLTMNSRRLPGELFVDLLADHGQKTQLYRPESVYVSQALTSHITNEGGVRLEDSAGALSPLFRAGNSAMLVSDAYYVFMPKQRSGEQWDEIERAIGTGDLYDLVAWEDARRNLVCPLDTCNPAVFPDFGSGRTLALSYCESDLPTVVKIVRDLFQRRRRYRFHLQLPEMAGGTSMDISENLIAEAGAALAIVSTRYIERALDNASHIAAEVRAMHGRSAQIPIVVLGVDDRNTLSAIPKWSWTQFNREWRGKEPIISNDAPLSAATEESIHHVIGKALEFIDEWSSHP